MAVTQSAATKPTTTEAATSATSLERSSDQNLRKRRAPRDVFREGRVSGFFKFRVAGRTSLDRDPLAPSTRLRLSQQVALGKTKCRCGIADSLRTVSAPGRDLKKANFLSSRRTSAVVCDARHNTRTYYAIEITHGGRSSAKPQDVSEEVSRNRDLGHLEGDIAAGAYDPALSLQRGKK